MNEPYNLAVRSPILPTPNYQYSPDTTRLTLEQEYNRLSNRMAPQQPQSTAYSDYVNVLNSCSDITRGRILEDDRFNNIYAQCEGYLKEYLYAQALPLVLETQQGRMAFEQLFAVTKALKEEYTQRDLQKERQLELLMQDEVVLRRLQELQQEQPQKPPSKSSGNQPTQSQKWNIRNNQNQQQSPSDVTLSEATN